MYTDPGGEWIEILAGVIGGITNVYQNRDHISNFKDWFVYYNIGNLAGSTSAMLGGLDIWDNPIASGFISGHSAGFITSQLNSLYQGAGPVESLGAGAQSGMVGGGVGAGIGAISMALNAEWLPNSIFGYEPHYKWISPNEVLGLENVGSYASSYSGLGGTFLGTGAQSLAAQNGGSDVEVYIWKKDPNNPRDVGHTAIRIGNNVYGYYPTDENGNGVFDNDELLKSHGQMHINSMNEFRRLYRNDQIDSYVLRTSGDQLNRLHDNLMRVSLDPGYYSLKGNNCTSVAYKALVKSRINIPRINISPFSSGTIGLTPKGLGALLNYSSNLLYKYSFTVR